MAPAEPETQSPERVADLIESLATVMCQSGVTELDLELGDISIRLRKPAIGESPKAGPRPTGELPEAPPAPPSGHVITAPMVGTFYAAPTPSAAAFVAVGDEIVAGQTVGIVEAMKIMNEIAADRGGIVDELIAANGQPVEYGFPLVRLLSSEKP